MRRALLGLCVSSALACGRLAGSDGSATSTSIDGTSTSDATSSGETGTTDGSPSGDTVDECVSYDSSISPVFVPSHLLLVVDTSSSMGAATWDHDDDPMTPAITRWSAARAGVEELLAGLAGQFEFGLQRYPSAEACIGGMCSDADVCLIGDGPEVALSLDATADILASLPSVDATVELVGGSPLRAAFASARAALEQEPSDVWRYVVLLTDGGSNCSEGALLPEAWEQYDPELAAAIQAGFDEAHITTAIVGIGVPEQELTPGEDSPQIDPFAALNELALVGGAPWDGGTQPRKFHTPAELPELIAKLIPPNDWTCLIALDELPVGAPKLEQVPFVELAIDGMEVAFWQDGCTDEDGWTWLEYGQVLTLCGPLCERFGTGQFDTFEIHYGCPVD